MKPTLEFKLTVDVLKRLSLATDLYANYIRGAFPVAYIKNHPDFRNIFIMNHLSNIIINKHLRDYNI